MVDKKTIKSPGQLPKGLLILVGIIIILVIVVSVVIKMVSNSEPDIPPEEGEEEEEEEAYQPIYEVIIGEIKFTFIKVQDKGNILRGSESKKPERQEDLTTKEKFIVVTIGAQNIGKEIITVKDKNWGIEEIIDNEGREFEFLGREADPWIPEESQCAALLKPAFSPIPCTKIYEVAKVSTDLKVKVFVEEKGITTRKEEALLDLKIY